MKRNPKLLYPIGVLLAAILVAVVLVAARPSPQVLPPRVPPPLVRATYRPFRGGSAAAGCMLPPCRERSDNFL